MTIHVAYGLPPSPIPVGVREMLHKYLDDMLNGLEWDIGPWQESAVGWVGIGDSGDIRLKVGREA